MSKLDDAVDAERKEFPDLTAEQVLGIAARVRLAEDAMMRVPGILPAQVPRLMRLVESLQRSWFEEMQERLFFPFYSANGKGAIAMKDLPKLDYSKGARPPIEQLIDALGEDGSIAEWFMYPDRGAIDELFLPSPIDGDDTVTLFEASIMIGERLLMDPASLCVKAPEHFASEIMNGAIDPRDPFTRLRLSEQPTEVPDLRWRIYPSELQEYAIKRWGRGVYTDTELYGEPEAEPNAAHAVAPEAQPSPAPGRNRTEQTLYQIICAMAMALAATDPDKLQKGGRPFVGYAKEAGAAGIVWHLLSGEFTDLKSSSLETHIGKALKSLH